MMKKISSSLLTLIMLLTVVFSVPAAQGYAAADGTGYYIITSSNGVNMRGGPGTKYPIVGTITANALIDVTQLAGDWGYTRYGGVDGWVLLDYAKKTTPNNQVFPIANIISGLNALRKKFPNGKYWNHYGSPNKNLDGWTNTPCPDGHYLNGVQQCNGQCDGFARKLGLDLFGVSTEKWEQRSTLDGLCVGDIIRYRSRHSIMVVGFGSNDDTLIVADCNWDSHCVIRWDASFSISRYIKEGPYYVMHYPGNTFTKSVFKSNKYPSAKLSSTSVAVNEGSTVKLTATTANLPAALKWRSSNTSIATVDQNGNVKGVAPGEAKITISCNSVDYDSCTVKVNAVPYAKLNASSATVSAGYTITLTATTRSLPTSLTWTSSNTSVVTVDQYGKVKGVAPGSASVTITCAGKNYGSCTVKVTKHIDITRLSGSNRVETSAAIASSGWSSGASNVIIANAMNYADALAGVPLSKALDAPMLLTSNTASGLESTVSSRLTALNAKNIYILGGTGAVSQAIEDTLRKNYTVTRIYGLDRFETSVRIAEKLNALKGKNNKAFAVTSHDFPDALSASSVAALSATPILYIRKDGTVEGSVQNYIKNAGIKNVTIVGGTGVISANAEKNLKSAGVTSTERVYGENRFATCVEVNKKYSSLFKTKTAALATGLSFPDALAGGAFAAKKSIPVILTGSANVYSGSTGYLKTYAPTMLYVFGGTGSVPDEVLYRHTDF